MRCWPPFSCWRAEQVTVHDQPGRSDLNRAEGRADHYTRERSPTAQRPLPVEAIHVHDVEAAVVQPGRCGQAGHDEATNNALLRHMHMATTEASEGTHLHGTGVILPGELEQAGLQVAATNSLLQYVTSEGEALSRAELLPVRVSFVVSAERRWNEDSTVRMPSMSDNVVKSMEQALAVHSPMLASWASDHAMQVAVFERQSDKSSRGHKARLSPLLQQDISLLQDLRLVEELGRGTSAVTFEGLWHDGGVQVAVKVMASPARGGESMSEMGLALGRLETSGILNSRTDADMAFARRSYGPERTLTTALTSTTAATASLLPLRALAEALISKNLSHPNIVRAYVVRCARLSLAFVAACHYGAIKERSDLRVHVRALLASMPDDVLHVTQQLHESVDLDEVADQVQRLCADWPGLLPPFPEAAGSLKASDESLFSEDGFGAPKDARSSLSWQQVLAATNAGVGDFLTVIIMRHCDMGTLATALATGIFCSSGNIEGSPAMAQLERGRRVRALLRTARELAQALEHLHACNVIHGDFKPSNVLLCGSRNDVRGFTVQVADFGLSRLRTCMVAGSEAGTFQYMSPELIGSGELTFKSDIYAFGITLWSMVTASSPFVKMTRGQVLRAVVHNGFRPAWPMNEYDAVVADLYSRCVSPDPEARPTAQALVKELAMLELNVRKVMHQKRAPGGGQGPQVAGEGQAQLQPEKQELNQDRQGGKQDAGAGNSGGEQAQRVQPQQGQQLQPRVQHIVRKPNRLHRRV